jgi:hypothetical protein
MILRRHSLALAVLSAALMKQKGMYDSLSPSMKAQVDALATQVGSSAPATQPQ